MPTKTRQSICTSFNSFAGTKWVDVPDRKKKEQQLATAILLLWIALESAGWGLVYGSAQGRIMFGRLFAQHVKPVFARIYGSARAALADYYGRGYKTTQGPDGAVIEVPGLDDVLRRYEQEVYESFRKRREKKEDWDRHKEDWDRAGIPEDERPRSIKDRHGRQINEGDAIFDEQDAETAGVSWTTDAHSHGEVDAAEELRAAGIELDAMWMIEPGACPVCEELAGMLKAEWSQWYPDGPTVHPNCRCWLKWVRVER